MTTITKEMAQNAKSKLQSNTWPSQAALGLTKVGADYAVKVNLSEPTDTTVLPQALDGVAVVYDMVGKVQAQQ